jgi:hypothetical protein
MVIDWIRFEVETRLCSFSCETNSFGSSHQVKVDVLLIVVVQMPAMDCRLTYFMIFCAVVISAEMELYRMEHLA